MAIELSEKQINDGWQIVKFGEIAKNISKRVEPSETDLEVYVGLEHLDPQSLRIARKGIIAEDNPSFTRRFSAGQILFGKRRCYQKKAAVADFEGICSGDIIVMDAIPKKIIPGLLPFIIQSDAFFDWAEKTSSGSLSPRTKWKSLAEFEFPLPPIERQKEILEVLEKVEYAAKHVDVTLESLDQARQRLEREFFSSILLFGESQEADCEIKTIGDLCEVKTGGTPKRAEPSYWEGDVPWMSSGEIHELYVSKTVEHITEKGLKNSNARMLPVDSVLIAMNGQGKTRGTVAMSKIPLTCNQSIAAVICDEDKLLPDFLFHYLSSKYEEIRNVTGEGRNGLNLGLIRNFRLPLLDVNKQKSISLVFNQLLSCKNNLSKRQTNSKFLLSQISDQLLMQAEVPYELQ
jgi:type I restriction enzyme S subunit